MAENTPLKGQSRWLKALRGAFYDVLEYAIDFAAGAVIGKLALLGLNEVVTELRPLWMLIEIGGGLLFLSTAAFFIFVRPGIRLINIVDEEIYRFRLERLSRRQEIQDALREEQRLHKNQGQSSGKTDPIPSPKEDQLTSISKRGRK